jgi:large subunit ribosomal protein L15
MSEILSRLAPPDGARHKERRKGRGPGSSQGKMSGKGFKGQKARHGGNFSKLHFQGGQTPIQRRLPKRGFRVPFPIKTIALNVGELERFAAGSTIDEAALRESRLVQGRADRIKILGDGELTKKLTVNAHQFSKSAQEKIVRAGGSVIVIESASAPSAE